LATPFQPADGIEASQSKIDAIQSYPVPTTRKQVRGFLGVCNFYIRYVHNFATIAHPLNQLLKKSPTIRIKWTAECQRVFDTLKEKLISPPILAFPNLNKPFRIAVDASATGIGYILSQIDDDNNERVICYGGRSLRNTEYAWSVTHKESLALIESVRQYHPYIANQPFEVFTDHISLTWLKDIKLATGRLARWSLLLQVYTFTITHRPGVRNQNAGALSRRSYESTPPDDADDEEEEEIIAALHVPTLPQSSSSHGAEVTSSIEEYHTATVPAIITLEHNSTGDINAVDVDDSDNEDLITPSATPAIEKETLQTLLDLQSQCPDFQPILQYLLYDILPDDPALSIKIVAESQLYIVYDKVFLHMRQGFPHQHPVLENVILHPHVRRVACDDVTISRALLLYKIAFILLISGCKQ